MNASMMHKRGIAMQYVAAALMPLAVGEKIPTVSGMCESSGCSHGNIQAALKSIQDMGGARFRPRGHLGTFVTEIDYLRLAGICGKDSMIGAMPLPYSRRYEGLATGIYSGLNHGRLTGHIAFTRGAGHRIELLKRGNYDFVVVSALALEEYRRQGHQLVSLINFGPSTYVERHAVAVRQDFDGSWAGARVAIDSSSLDQQLLTTEFFQDKPVTFVPMPYNQIFAGIERGTIDGGVWSVEDAGIPRFQIRFVELGETRFGDTDTEAVIICRGDDNITKRLLPLLLRRDEICAIQRQVLDGERIPQY